MKINAIFELTAVEIDWLTVGTAGESTPRKHVRNAIRHLIELELENCVADQINIEHGWERIS